MQVQINGQSMSFAEGTSVAGAVDQLKLNTQRVVVECNRRILDKSDFVSTYLREGDEVEIIQFVPGG